MSVPDETVTTTEENAQSEQQQEEEEEPESAPNEYEEDHDTSTPIATVRKFNQNFCFLLFSVYLFLISSHLIMKNIFMMILHQNMMMIRRD